jgi:hypothetical protein
MDNGYPALLGDRENLIQMISDQRKNAVDSELQRTLDEQFSTSRHLCHTNLFDA